MKNTLYEQAKDNLKKNEEEKKKRAAERVTANIELAFQTKEKAARAAELVTANKELAFQTKEKANRAAELVTANKELAFQTKEKADRATELVTANRELAFQTKEKADRATELVTANKELAFQTKEKADRAAELVTANKELAFQTKEILYLCDHDELTGLYNRRYYEEELKRLDHNKYLPLTIVMGDINGLKLINDSFGHIKGDELLQKTAEVIKMGCRAKDIIARLGGDEFVIIMPNTNFLEAEKVITRIYTLASKEKAGTLDISISFGYETKINGQQKMIEVYKTAEDHMYEHKTYERSSTRSNIIDLIMNTLYEKSNRELFHSKRVSELCETIAEKMDFGKDGINQMRIAGLMHDIGKIGIDEKILNKPGKLSTDEWTEMKKHPEIGHRILSSDRQFTEIAEYVFEHQEYFNGMGYPRGLKGEEISIQSRIITIADTFDAMTSKRNYGEIVSVEDAVKEIKRCSGTQFDPNISRVFVEKVLKKEWGGLSQKN